MNVFAFDTICACETPESPPGDYNLRSFAAASIAAPKSRVKHLNPRQGITTTPSLYGAFGSMDLRSVKHLNPRQGITTADRQSLVAVMSDRL